MIYMFIVNIALDNVILLIIWVNDAEGVCFVAYGGCDVFVEEVLRVLWRQARASLFVKDVNHDGVGGEHVLL